MSEYIVPEEVLTAHLEEEAVILNMRTKNYHRLNGTAAAIWKGLEMGTSRDVLLDQLCARYEVDRDTAERAFERLCEGLLVRELIVPAPSPDA